MTHNQTAIAALPPLEAWDDPEAGSIIVRATDSKALVATLYVGALDVPQALALADLIADGPALVIAARILFDSEGGGPRDRTTQPGIYWEAFERALRRIEYARTQVKTKPREGSPVDLAARLLRLVEPLRKAANAPRFTEIEIIRRVAADLNAMPEEAANDYAAHVQEGGLTYRETIDVLRAELEAMKQDRDLVADAFTEIETRVQQLRNVRGGGA